MTKIRLGIALVSLLAFPALAPATAQATTKWRLDSWANTTAKPGSQIEYWVQARNFGDTTIPPVPGGNAENCVPGAPAPADPAKCFTVRADFPPGLTPVKASASGMSCTTATTSIVCTSPGDPGGEVTPIYEAGRGFRRMIFTASVSPAAAGTLTAAFEVSGGEAQGATAADPTQITSAAPAFGIDAFDVLAADESGEVQSAAGTHPFDFTVWTDFNTYKDLTPNVGGNLTPVEGVRDAIVELPPGFAGNPTIADRCTTGDLAEGQIAEARPLCSPSSQIGTVLVKLNGITGFETVGPLPLFNMQPPPGVAARFGFNIYSTLIMLDARLTEVDGAYRVVTGSLKTPQALGPAGVELKFWGVPADPVHKPERACPGEPYPRAQGSSCPTGAPQRPFFRLPTSCSAQAWSLHIDSWPHPAAFSSEGLPDLSDPNWKTRSVVSHRLPGYSADPSQWGQAVEGTDCDKVPVKGKLTARPTSIDTETSSGLDVHVEVPNPGLDSPEGVASSDIKRVKVTLPEGVTINPSQAVGLGVCPRSAYEGSALSFYDVGPGCPSNSKIGTVSVKTPLLDETIPGEVFIAEQDNPSTAEPGAENPFDSLLAIYVVLKEPQRGILVKLAGKVETDERTGRIVTTFDDLPQVPFSSFDFHFREGARAPLVTPPACGTYTTEAEFTPWSDPSRTLTSDSSFEIVHGIGGGPCPGGGLPPFKPGLIAGTINNAAGSYSPFHLRLFRTDGEQEFTHFSIKLPPGLTGKLAGIPFCPDAAIAAAAVRTGAEELASPSCPAASWLDNTLVGAGVGSVLAYAPGKVYLAGPYNGAPFSFVAITAAKVGPFDLGTVVVRFAVRINPETAEVFIDATGSDPIPHIIKGITTHLRDIRVYVDRPEFVLNPTSCAPTSTASTVLGSGLDFASEADDNPITVTSPFQAADCAALGFKPTLKLRLRGGTRRGAFPVLRAELRQRPGEASISRARVTLPHSEFLEQGHIGTVCTRVQFAAGAGDGTSCPAASVYGHARAITPLLDQPLEGPVFLRSNPEHELPDLVAALHGQEINIDLVGHVEGVKGGMIRNTFETVPDAPVSKFVLEMRGGKKGLLVNSTDICAGTHRATVNFDGHNGKIRDFRPALKAKCAKARKKTHGKHHHRHH